MHRPPIRLLLIVLLAGGLVAGCTGPDADSTPAAADARAMPPVEATSLFGEPLHRRVLDDEAQVRLEADYDSAMAVYRAHPDDVEAVIWVGRRAAYLWRYQDAIDFFTEGLSQYPDDPRLFRHRGHRYITTRQFDKAVTDLERAAALIEGTEDQVEPDGQPNEAGIPTSTLHTNIWYHLGLAYYLQGRFEEALAAYQNCMAAADNNDMRVATADWLYMTLRRLGRDAEAAEVLGPITPDMELLENVAYHRRLLMYKGLVTPDSLLSVSDGADPELTTATQAYGVGNWYLYNGDTEQATVLFRRILEGPYWAAFGYIAAEADLKRLADAG